MAAAKTVNKDGGNNNINREEIQAAIAKAVELRALHAALIQGNSNNINSPSHVRFLSSNSSQFSGHDYPVFTPTYEDEPLPGYSHLQLASQTISENWEESDNQTGFPSGLLVNSDQNLIFPEDDHDNKSSNYYNILVPLTNSHATLTGPHKKPRGMIRSWLFKRKQKTEKASPLRTECEEISRVFTDLGKISVETLKKELIDANQKRQTALIKVSELRSSFGELKKKLDNLESYCKELKTALKQALSKKNGDNLMPVSEESMVEGFLKIVSEARLTVKQFCKGLIEQIDNTDEQLTENLNLLLKPYKLCLNSRHSKAVFYHLEAIINQGLYQDFENCVFQKNGTPKILDPHQQRLTQFQSFVSLRNLGWAEVLKKGTKYYSEEFSKFCDRKMGCIFMSLNWTRPWSETLLQSFFVATKCIWLLHLLAFSFYPPLGILRVEDNRPFDGHYMEDIVGDKQRGTGPSRVKIMVMPGFYVQDKILRCKVLCRYKSVV